MPRTPGISYYPSRGGYYTKIAGQQHCLAIGPEDGGSKPPGPTYTKASEAFYLLLHAAYEGGKVSNDVPLSAVVVRYYAHFKNEKRLSTLSVTKSLLDNAIRHFGHRLKVGDLRGYIVDDWLTANTAWNASTKNLAATRVIAALNWAVGAGVIESNPIRGFKKPEARARGKEAIIPSELQELLIASADAGFARVLRFLQRTGARPGEAAHVECKHYDCDSGALVLPWNPAPGEWRWKNAPKTKRDRVIPLDAGMRQIIEELIREHGGKGRLFLSCLSAPLSAHRMTKYMTALRARENIKAWHAKHNHTKPATLYGFRHSFITAMLLKGCPIKLLADWCGTSVGMIEKHYSHAADDRVAMRRLFDQYTTP